MSNQIESNHMYNQTNHKTATKTNHCHNKAKQFSSNYKNYDQNGSNQEIVPKISQELQTQPGQQERLGHGVPNIAAKRVVSSIAAGEWRQRVFASDPAPPLLVEAVSATGGGGGDGGSTACVA